MNTKISQDEEFLDPNVNYRILMAELRERIVKLQHDINNIQDEVILGLAQKEYTDLKIRYFKLLRDDLFLQTKFVTQGILEEGIQSLKPSEEWKYGKILCIRDRRRI